MTPQLQQAIRLLQLPVLDLNAQIQDALEENIMLEMEDLPDVPKTSDESTAEIETIRAEDQWQTRADRRIQDGGWNGEGRPISEFADESGQTLREHLLWQLEMGQFSPREAVIGEAIIDAINDDGYLTIGLNEIEEILEPEAGVRREEIEAALAEVQRFDPAGIGARRHRRPLPVGMHHAAVETARRGDGRAGTRNGPCQPASRPRCDTRIRRAAAESEDFGRNPARRAGPDSRL
jgi:RNA polymerase sigma-54 factor